MKFNLFINYYNDQVQERTDELNFCLLENLKNPRVNKVVAICTSSHLEQLKKFVLANDSIKKLTGALSIFGGGGKLWSKIVPVIRENRPSFNDYFNIITGLFPDADNINVIANMDIIISEDTIIQSELYVAPNKCLALTRYDSNSKQNYIGDSKYLNNPDSQDSWIFNGAVKEVNGANFPLGIAGTDNKIAYLLHTAGYEVSNPSLTLKTYHLHLTNVRNYGVRDEDRLQPPFLILHPTK